MLIYHNGTQCASRFRYKKASLMGGFFVRKSHDRLKGSLRSIAFGINLFPRCEKTSRRKLVYFGILKRFENPLSPFMIAISRNHFKYSCTLFGFKMFWTERCASSTDQGKFQRWKVKALIKTMLRHDNFAPCSC